MEGSVFEKLPKERLRELIIELEEEIYRKCPNVDTIYRKRV